MGKVTTNVNAKTLDTGRNATMSRDEAIDRAKEIVADAAQLYSAGDVSAEVVLATEGAESDPVQKVKFKMVFGGDVIVQSAHSRSVKKALERAENELDRQVRKLKSRRVDHRRRERAGDKRQFNEDGSKFAVDEYDLDGE